MKTLYQMRQEKERGVSVQDVIDSLNGTELTEIAVIAINKNDEPLTAYSYDDLLQVIGAIEILKQTLIDKLNYPEEL